MGLSFTLQFWNHMYHTFLQKTRWPSWTISSGRPWEYHSYSAEFNLTKPKRRIKVMKEWMFMVQRHVDNISAISWRKSRKILLNSWTKQSKTERWQKSENRARKQKRITAEIQPLVKLIRFGFYFPYEKFLNWRNVNLCYHHDYYKRH